MTLVPAVRRAWVIWPDCRLAGPRERLGPDEWAEEVRAGDLHNVDSLLVRRHPNLFDAGKRPPKPAEQPDPPGSVKLKVRDDIGRDGVLHVGIGRMYRQGDVFSVTPAVAERLIADGYVEWIEPFLRRVGGDAA